MNENQIENYPEHVKLMAISEKSQICGEFVDWLSDEKDIHLVKFENTTHVIVNSQLREFLAEFFDIDLKKINKEKEAMLTAIRRMIDVQQERVDKLRPRLIPLVT